MTQVQSDLASLSTTVSGLATSNADLASDLADALAALEALSTQIGNVASEEDLTAITDALADVQADVTELLSKNAVINQSVTIRNPSQLELAETLIGTATTDPNVIINGSLTVELNPTNFTAAEIARVNAVTAKIATVLQNVSLTNTTSPSVAIDVSSLSFIDNHYTITGADANDPALRTISGDLDIEHGGEADYSQLTTVGDDVRVNTGITSLNLAGVEIADDLTTDGFFTGNLTLPKATSVNVGTADVRTVSLTLATDITLGYAGTIGGAVLIEAPKASTIDFAAAVVNGSLTVTGKGDTTIFTASNLASTTLGGATITVEEANFPKLTQFNGNTTITADTVTFPELAVNTGGTIDLPTADAFVAPKFTISNNVSATDAVTVEFASGNHTNLSAPKVKTLTISKQGNTTSFYTAGYAALETFNFTGVVGTKAPLISTVTNTINVQGGALKNVTIAGMADSVVVSDTGALVGLTTEGQIRNFTLYNADKLASATIGHAHIEGSDPAMFTVQGNDILAALAPTNLDETGNILITDNAKLASLDLSSLRTIPLGGSYNVGIYNNKLTGTYTAAIAGSLTTSPVLESLTSAALATIKPYLKLAVDSRASATTGNVTYTLAVNLSDVDPGNTTTSLTTALTNDTVRTETDVNPITDAYLVKILND